MKRHQRQGESRGLHQPREFRGSGADLDHRVHAIHALQRAVGNRTVEDMISRSGSRSVSGGSSSIDRPLYPEVKLNPGRPLDDAQRAGRDVSADSLLGLEVHMGSGTDRFLSSRNAHAGAMGRHIALSSDLWNRSWRRAVLAHEIAHVLQQHSMSRPRGDQRLLEADADRFSRDVSAGRAADVAYSAPRGWAFKAKDADAGDKTVNDMSPMKTFPFRATRFGGAPIRARRDGEFIVVKLPIYVWTNRDFKRDTDTLPLQAFTTGIRLRPDELVRVHIYEPRWYHLNITGSTDGDIEREIVITGEQMLAISDASTRATLMNIALTGVDAATVVLPVGKLVQPLARAGRIGLASTMIGVARAEPTVFAGAASRAAVTVVEEQVTQQVAGQAIKETVAHTVVQGGKEAAAAGAGQVVAQTGGQQVVSQAAKTGAADVAVKSVASAGVDAAGTQAAHVLNPVPGATEVKLSESGYRGALSHTFPAHALDPVFSAVDGIGQRAAQRAVQNPAFVQAVQNGNWTLAGTLYHSAAAQEARALPAAALPAGWRIEAERGIQSGAGGGRADILLHGPGNIVAEVDWKTTGRSALSSASRSEMTRHAGQITTNIGGTLSTQQSRSWIDHVRPLLPGIKWPRG